MTKSNIGQNLESNRYVYIETRQENYPINGNGTTASDYLTRQLSRIRFRHSNSYMSPTSQSNKMIPTHNVYNDQ